MQEAPLSEHEAVLNIRYDLKREVWAKVGELYTEMPGWLGYGDGEQGEQGIPYWFGYNRFSQPQTGPYIAASSEPGGLQIVAAHFSQQNI